LPSANLPLPPTATLSPCSSRASATSSSFPSPTDAARPVIPSAARNPSSFLPCTLCILFVEIPLSFPRNKNARTTLPRGQNVSGFYQSRASNHDSFSSRREFALSGTFHQHLTQRRQAFVILFH